MNKKQKDYNWIMNIIDSCDNTFHFDCVDSIIELFEKKYNDGHLATCLKTQRNEHFNDVHSILQ
jgi:hypothetical protein